MTGAMISELKRWALQQQSSPRVLMLSGTGGKAFCAGGDVVILQKANATEGADKSIMSRFFAQEFLVDYVLS